VPIWQNLSLDKLDRFINLSDAVAAQGRRRLGLEASVPPDVIRVHSAAYAVQTLSSDITQGFVLLQNDRLLDDLDALRTVKSYAPFRRSATEAGMSREDLPALALSYSVYRHHTAESGDRELWSPRMNRKLARVLRVFCEGRTGVLLWLDKAFSEFMHSTDRPVHNWVAYGIEPYALLVTISLQSGLPIEDYCMAVGRELLRLDINKMWCAIEVALSNEGFGSVILSSNSPSTAIFTRLPVQQFTFGLNDINSVRTAPHPVIEIVNETNNNTSNADCRERAVHEVSARPDLNRVLNGVLYGTSFEAKSTRTQVSRRLGIDYQPLDLNFISILDKASSELAQPQESAHALEAFLASFFRTLFDFDGALSNEQVARLDLCAQRVMRMHNKMREVTGVGIGQWIHVGPKDKLGMRPWPYDADYSSFVILPFYYSHRIDSQSAPCEDLVRRIDELSNSLGFGLGYPDSVWKSGDWTYVATSAMNDVALVNHGRAGNARGMDLAEGMKETESAESLLIFISVMDGMICSGILQNMLSKLLQDRSAFAVSDLRLVGIAWPDIDPVAVEQACVEGRSRNMLLPGAIKGAVFGAVRLLTYHRMGIAPTESRFAALSACVTLKNSQDAVTITDNRQVGIISNPRRFYAQGDKVVIFVPFSPYLFFISFVLLATPVLALFVTAAWPDTRSNTTAVFLAIPPYLILVNEFIKRRLTNGISPLDMLRRSRNVEEMSGMDLRLSTEESTGLAESVGKSLLEMVASDLNTCYLATSRGKLILQPLYLAQVSWLKPVMTGGARLFLLSGSAMMKLTPSDSSGLHFNAGPTQEMTTSDDYISCSTKPFALIGTHANV
jgi:hypothetical protein